MKKKLCLLLLFCLAIICVIAKTNHKVNKVNLKNLKSYYKNHQVINNLNKVYFIIDPKDNLNANLVFDKKRGLIFDQSYSVYKNSIVYSSSDSITFNQLSPSEIQVLGLQVNRLIFMLKTLGSPFFHGIAIQDKISTYLIISENDKNQNLQYESLFEGLNHLHKELTGCIIYLKFNEIRRMNNHLEYSVSLLAEHRLKSKNDFIEMNFHLNSKNEIDLAMIKLYKNITN